MLQSIISEVDADLAAAINSAAAEVSATDVVSRARSVPAATRQGGSFSYAVNIALLDRHGAPSLFVAH